MGEITTEKDFIAEDAEKNGYNPQITQMTQI
jgi:hypothetical protein